MKQLFPVLRLAAIYGQCGRRKKRHAVALIVIQQARCGCQKGGFKFPGMLLTRQSLLVDQPHMYCLLLCVPLGMLPDKDPLLHHKILHLSLHDLALLGSSWGVPPEHKQLAPAASSDLIVSRIPCWVLSGTSRSYSAMPTAGHEFLALAWVLEQSSRAIAHTLRQIPNPSAAAVVVPDIEGLPSERMYEMFALAVEFAYHGHVELADADVLDLWAVAASLQVICPARFLLWLVKVSQKSLEMHQQQQTS